MNTLIISPFKLGKSVKRYIMKMSKISSAFSIPEKIVNRFIDRNLFDSVNIIIREIVVKKSACLAVALPNGIEKSVTIMLLLGQHVNFFLHSDIFNSSSKLPSFCDYMLVLDEVEKKGSAVRNLHLIPNINFVPVNRSDANNRSRIYLSSSGTTGIPKIVCFERQKFLQNAAHCVTRFGLSDGCKVLISVPTSHMFGLGAALVPSLMAHCDISLLHRPNIVQLIETISSFRPDFVFVTPAILRMFLSLRTSLKHTCTFITAGEVVPDILFRTFIEKVAPLINLYGCTELGAIATTMPHLSCIGQFELYPLPGVQVTFAGASGNQIYLKHSNHFDYYVGSNGERNSTDDPTTLGFETNDIGVDLKFGGFRVSGRSDSQINRCGFLVSIHEIENKIQELFPDIPEVVVVEVPDDTVMDSSLIAFCQQPKRQSISELMVKESCAKDLHKYCRPDRIVFLTNFPRTENGKIDRKKLMKLSN